MQISRCRCGAAPAFVEKSIATNAIDPWAIHCSEFCGDDSHWQLSLAEAVKRWNAGIVRGASGGNGAASDDIQVVN